MDHSMVHTPGSGNRIRTDRCTDFWATVLHCRARQPPGMRARRSAMGSGWPVTLILTTIRTRWTCRKGSSWHQCATSTATDRARACPSLRRVQSVVSRRVHSALIAQLEPRPHPAAEVPGCSPW